MKRIIVALDTADIERAERLVSDLQDLAWGFKLGLEFFAAHGPDGVRRIVGAGVPVMLDLKLHDIPRTVERATAQAVKLGVTMITVHAAGGRKMMASAVTAAGDVVVLGVTTLTSELDGSQVLRLAYEAMIGGCGGAVCSPREVQQLRGTMMPADFRLVTPGIREDGAPPDDQARTATVAEALATAADYLVIGRPIVETADPRGALVRILQHTKEAAANHKDAKDGNP